MQASWFTASLMVWQIHYYSVVVGSSEFHTGVASYHVTQADYQQNSEKTVSYNAIKVTN